MAHTFLALRAGGIINIDDSSQGSSVADHGQIAPTALAADPVQSLATGGTTVTVPQLSMPVLQTADPAAPQLVAVPGVVTDPHGSLELRSGDTVTVSSSSDGTDGSEASALLSLNQLSFLDNGWFVVPSADNEYGPAVYAAADDYGWSVAAGEFSTDWFIA